MIALTRIRALDLAEPPDTGRPLHLSAASGLLRINNHLYVIADDELHLGVFNAEDTAPGHLIRLFEGALPHAKAGRKKEKPDFESLVHLPPDEAHKHGAILALGSGSRPNRCLGALLPLNQNGSAGTARIVDLAPLLLPLNKHFPSLNIEGAVVSGGALCLFQRRNTNDSANAIIRVPLHAFLEMLSGSLHEIVPTDIMHVDLGDIDGVPLGFTDAAPLPDGNILFTAVAEDTTDTYNDGHCMGAGVGIVAGTGKLLRLERFDAPHKIEGVVAGMDGSTIRMLLVTDADDADIAASLYSASIPY